MAGKFYVKVDPINAGQFFACCGLFELAHRIWPGVEAWFDEALDKFWVVHDSESLSLKDLFRELCCCEIKLVEESVSRSGSISRRGKGRAKNKKDTGQKDDDSGKQEREGAIALGGPFNLILHWWGEGEEPKLHPWAGQQRPYKIARATRKAIRDRLAESSEQDLVEIFDFYETQMIGEDEGGTKARAESVEPFYFDSRRYLHALDVGFSTDELGMDVVVYPAVELLALIGIQRFRPQPLAKLIRSGQLESQQQNEYRFVYAMWTSPLPINVAGVVASGRVPHPKIKRFRFELLPRDAAGRYRAFSRATPI